MLKQMALLDMLIRKFGEAKGRKKYSRWHRRYPATVLREIRTSTAL
jgi:hypothetical protein